EGPTTPSSGVSGRRPSAPPPTATPPTSTPRSPCSPPSRTASRRRDQRMARLRSDNHNRDVDAQGQAEGQHEARERGDHGRGAPPGPAEGEDEGGEGGDHGRAAAPGGASRGHRRPRESIPPAIPETRRPVN